MRDLARRVHGMENGDSPSQRAEAPATGNDSRCSRQRTVTSVTNRENPPKQGFSLVIVESCRELICIRRAATAPSPP